MEDGLEGRANSGLKEWRDLSELCGCSREHSEYSIEAGDSL